MEFKEDISILYKMRFLEIVITETIDNVIVAFGNIEITK
ncbi:hypothetical protein IKK_05359 [Bacillus mycoides]|nr:hypothetical protein IKK_05359 [Bacillus mycoides]OSY02570.1 hypothetical protein S2E19_03852 [Bacillus mycoides]